ncbi:hypothetical protein HDU77_011825 [Chytriomyces hyalinus]|nr:hypothetical protein HDU77_011825 [Chytriomyces hyalinus]
MCSYCTPGPQKLYNYDQSESMKSPLFHVGQVVAAIHSGMGFTNIRKYLQMIGISSFIPERSYYQLAKDQKLSEKILSAQEECIAIAHKAAIDHAISRNNCRILSYGYDCGWTHVCNAAEGIGCMISSIRIPGYYSYPVTGIAIICQSWSLTLKDGLIRTIREGVELASNQFEHTAIRSILTDVAFTQPIIENNMNMELNSDGDRGLVGIVKTTPFIRQLNVNFSHYKKNVKSKMEKHPQKKAFQQFYASIMDWFDGTMYTAKAYARTKNGFNSKYYLEELVPAEISESQLTFQLIDGYLSHAQNEHAACWKTFCFINANEGMKPNPNLMRASQPFLLGFRSFLSKIFEVQGGRSRITDTTSCPK